MVCLTSERGNEMSLNQGKQSPVEFAERVRDNQRKLRDRLRSRYDFIVCGSGSSGSVVARRLAENPDVSVLLLEAGGSDEVPSVTEAARWHENLGSERDWKFVDQPNPHLNGRSILLEMGKVLGGGSSINVMGWARGHKSDWDFFASESGEAAWNYESALEIYRRMEDWQGAPDPTRRGTGGLVFVQSAPDPNPIAPAMVDAARSIGMPTFDSNNGRMMEGVYHVQGKKPAQAVCSRLEVIAQSRNEHSNEWGYVLRWDDPDGHPHEWSFPKSLIMKQGTDLSEVLAKGGLNIAPERQALIKEYISAVNPSKRLRNVSRPGWHKLGSGGLNGGRVFVLPGQVIGQSGGEGVILQHDAHDSSPGTARGMLSEWQPHLAKLCVGNDILAFGVSIAFAAPLLELLDKDSGGFHFYGVSSSGKSTALKVAASVWTSPVETWRTTDNALEDTAERHNDILLALDELAQVDPKKAAEVAYMLGNGEGKQRLNQQIMAQPKKKWRVLFLSTGETTLSQHAEEAGKRITGGTEVRMVNIDADAGTQTGIFKDIHGESSPAVFADKLKGLASTYQGTAGPAFVEYVIKNESQVVQRIRSLMGEFNLGVPDGSSGEISRVADRFGLVGAAGEVAIEAGITPWPQGSAMDAAHWCFDAWLKGRTTGSSDIEKGIEQIRAFLLSYGDARFQELASDNTFIASGGHPINNRAGFRREVEENDGGVEYLIPSEIFKTEICKGCNFTKVAQELHQRDYLRRSSADRLQVQHRIEGMGKNPIRFYAINSSIFGEAESGPVDESEAA